MDSNLIYDVGFNDGSDTDFYLSQGYRVVAVEANPALAEAGRQRFRHEIERGTLRILNVGIAEFEGHKDFWICDEKPQFSSFHERSATRDSYKHHRISVSTVRFGTVLKEHGTPVYLKIDIEGNEHLCLQDLSRSSLPRFVSVEAECPSRKNQAGVDEGLATLQALKNLGYDKFKLIHQLTFSAASVPYSLQHLLDLFSCEVLLAPPANRVWGSYLLASHLMVRPSLERKFGRHFPVGSSGVWGEHTAGHWMSYNKAVRSYCYFRKKHLEAHGGSSFSFWFDWHAKV